MDLYDLLDEVKDRESFLTFVRALYQDREEEVKYEKINPSPPYSPGANGWENGSIESFLEAAVACTEDSLGSEHEMPAEPQWQAFANFLMAGKVYE